MGENFDPDKLEVRNEALGGTSSRTFYNDPNLWPNILTQIQPGDFIMMQFGHNDSSPIVDSLRARGTMKGNGNEFVEVRNPLSQKKEKVFTYGNYLRKFVNEIHRKRAIAIVCSPIPRNNWSGNRVLKTDYAIWAQEAAKQAKAHFLPLEDLIIGEYEELGKDYVARIFFDPKDGTHTLLEGAKLNSSLIANYFYENPEIGLKQYLH